MTATVDLADILAGTDALAHLDAAHQAAWEATDPDLLRLCQRRMAMIIGHEPTVAAMSAEEQATLAAWSGSPAFGERERAALALTEQYTIDVAAATDEQVAALAEHLGAHALLDFAHALLVVEQRMRLELAFAAVMGQP